MADIDLAPQPDTDYGFATERDVHEYSIHSLAATAALINIQNMIDNYYPSDRSLQAIALHTYLKQFNLSDDSPTLVKDLMTIRKHSINNMYVDDEWD